MKCNDMKCKLNESIQHKIEVSIHLFFSLFYYFKVTRMRETVSLKLEISWGRTPRPRALVWEFSLFSKSQGWQVCATYLTTTQEFVTRTLANDTLNRKNKFKEKTKLTKQNKQNKTN